MVFGDKKYFMFQGFFLNGLASASSLADKTTVFPIKKQNTDKGKMVVGHSL